MWMFGPMEETTEPQGGGCSGGVQLRRVSPGFANMFGALKNMWGVLHCARGAAC